MAVLQKENAAVARLESRLLTAEQALAREGATPRKPAPSEESEPPLSEAARAYLLDMQAQLISLELELSEERRKCAFMQVSPPRSSSYNVSALAGLKVWEMGEGEAGALRLLVLWAGLAIVHSRKLACLGSGGRSVSLASSLGHLGGGWPVWCYPGPSFYEGQGAREAALETDRAAKRFPLLKVEAEPTSSKFD